MKLPVKPIQLYTVDHLKEPGVQQPSGHAELGPAVLCHVVHLLNEIHIELPLIQLLIEIAQLETLYLCRLLHRTTEKLDNFKFLCSIIY